MTVVLYVLLLSGHGPCVAHTLAVPLIALFLGVLARVRQQGTHLLLVATRVWFSEMISLLARGDSSHDAPCLSGAGDSVFSLARALEPSCLAPEGD